MSSKPSNLTILAFFWVWFSLNMCPNCQFLPFGLIHSQWKETLSPDQPRLGKYIMVARQQVKKALCPGKPRIWAHILWDQPLDRAWAFEREPRLASSLHPTCLPTGTEIMECSWMYCKARTIKSNLAFFYSFPAIPIKPDSFVMNKKVTLAPIFKFCERMLFWKKQWFFCFRWLLLHSFFFAGYVWSLLCHWKQVS